MTCRTPWGPPNQDLWRLGAFLSSEETHWVEGMVPTQWGGCCLHFTGEELETQRSKIIWPRLYNMKVAKLGQKSDCLTLKLLGPYLLLFPCSNLETQTILGSHWERSKGSNSPITWPTSWNQAPQASLLLTSVRPVTGPHDQMSKYTKVINPDNKLLNEICPVSALTNITS